MAKQKVVSGKDLLRFLEYLGFNVTRIKGSHHRLKHSDGRVTTVAVHGNEDIPQGTFRKIIREDLELDLETFNALWEQFNK